MSFILYLSEKVYFVMHIIIIFRFFLNDILMIYYELIKCIGFFTRTMANYVFITIKINVNVR